MPFIPIDKMRQLREAAKQGDERAKKILRAQLDGSDYGADLDAYFAPKPEPKPMPVNNPGSAPKQATGQGTGNAQLDEWLRSNGIHETDEDYEDAINEYYMEYPEQRPAEDKAKTPILHLDGLKDYQEASKPRTQEDIDCTKDIATSIFEAIKKCDETNLSIMQNGDLDPAAKKGAMTTIQEIKQALMDSAEKLVKIKDSLAKKEEVSEVM